MRIHDPADAVMPTAMAAAVKKRCLEILISDECHSNQCQSLSVNIIIPRQIFPEFSNFAGEFGNIFTTNGAPARAGIFINQIMKDYRTGNGYDVHALKNGLKMWLCGIQIPCEMGFVAHSDGDVAIHALCDALLGAAALGDIGYHFPDSDPRFKGIDSKRLLAEVVRLIGEKGYQVGNADVTIALQAPKLRPHIDTMRKTLAEVMGVEIDRVSVKATTTERLGFVGRGEGCEVWASASIFKEL